MGRRGRRRAKKEAQENTYWKMYVSFVCSNEDCRRTWNSAHGWELEKELKNVCYSCNKQGKLLEVKEMMLELGRWVCVCGAAWWNLLYDWEMCNCGRQVAQPGQFQSRHGTWYFFKCKNKSCKEKPEWEDFSTAKQKSQRCNKCFGRGDITQIQKLDYRMLRRNDRRRKDSKYLYGRDRYDEPSKHDKSNCEMCDLMIGQGYRSCHDYKQVKTQMEVERYVRRYGRRYGIDQYEKIISAW